MRSDKELMAKILIGTAALALFLSLLVPYWKLRVVAPQYPKGLGVAIYLDRVEGDVREIDNLNHYIGMRSLKKAAPLERKMAVPGLILTALLLLAAIFSRRRLSILLTIPAIVLPTFFALDLYWWLRDFGLNLDSRAPLSSSIGPFIPPLLGKGQIAQFHATATFSLGFFLSFFAASFALIALVLRFGGRRIPWTLKLAALFVSIGFFSSWAPCGYAETLNVGEHSTYQTIQKALDHASEGDTIEVKPGVYAGPLRIQKTVNLIGMGMPVVEGQGQDTVVRVEAQGVRFEGFVVRNSGDSLLREDAGILVTAPRATIQGNRFENVLFGIYLRQAPESEIRANILSSKALPVARRGDLIKVWYSDRTIIEGNQTTSGRDVVLWFSRGLLVRRNTFQGGRYGIHFMYCHDAVAEENTLIQNSVGAYLMYGSNLILRRNRVANNRGVSGYGIGFKDMTNASIEDNIMVNNRVGLFFDTSSGTYLRNLIAYNDIGVKLLPSASGNHFSGNSLMDNGKQVEINGLGQSDKNQWQGNFWSDYRGYDQDRDGKGDFPYQAQEFFEAITERYPSLKIFVLSPSEEALDFAASIFPIFAPKPEFKDSSPLMSPQIPSLGRIDHNISFVWILVSGILLVPVAFVFKNRSLEVRI